MSKKKTSDSYEVGYGNPPQDTQFQKGVSGNPRGRPKKVADFDSELLRESKSPITITDNGRRSRISKHAGVIKQLINKALTGNIHAAGLYLGHYQEALEKAALSAGLQPNNSGEFKADDYTDDELLELALTGGLKKMKKT